MSSHDILIGLAGVLFAAAPVVFATIGETLTERSGIINLSVNGTILLAAMASFAVSVSTHSLWLGFLMGMVIGALVALTVAFSSIALKQSQVAVGFVLTLMTRDLSYFLGNPYMGLQGPRVQSWPIPVLSQIPIVGPLFFQQDPLTYLSFILIGVAWWWVFRTRPGLTLQAVGERPEAAYARGAAVNKLRYLYAALGGALVGLGFEAKMAKLQLIYSGAVIKTMRRWELVYTRLQGQHFDFDAVKLSDPRAIELRDYMRRRLETLEEAL